MKREHPQSHRGFVQTLNTECGRSITLTVESDEEIGHRDWRDARIGRIKTIRIEEAGVSTRWERHNYWYDENGNFVKMTAEDI